MPDSAEPTALYFPHPLTADDDGFLAYGGDLHPQRLILAYRFGIFPWYDQLPILWWAPQQRFVIDIADIHISKSMRKYLKRPIFSITVDRCFDQVIHLCQTSNRKNQSGTWITRDMKSAYIDLHQMGIAHSVEIWQDKTLVGGVYGVGIGTIFSGESMFSKVSDASKFAILVLAKVLASKGYTTLDCQQHSNHIEALGGYLISNESYHERIWQNLTISIDANIWDLQSSYYYEL